MPSTVQITIASTATGLPEGGTDSISITLSNTSGVGTMQYTTCTTGGSSLASTVSLPSSAKFMIVIMPSTNTIPCRIANNISTDPGIPLSSQGASLFSIPPGPSTFYFYTTGTSAVTPVRIIAY